MQLGKILNSWPWSERTSSPPPPAWRQHLPVNELRKSKYNHDWCPKESRTIIEASPAHACYSLFLSNSGRKSQLQMYHINSVRSLNTHLTTTLQWFQSLREFDLGSVVQISMILEVQLAKGPWYAQLDFSNFDRNFMLFLFRRLPIRWHPSFFRKSWVWMWLSMVSSILGCFDAIYMSCIFSSQNFKNTS